MGMCDGVTTNPSLMAQVGRTDTDALLKEICAVVQGPVSGEVTALDAEGMIKEGRRLAKLDKHIVVKVPTTYEGLKAMAALAADGIPVNATLVFSVNQALLVAKAGAAYVSPFVGRLDDVGEDGMQLIADIVEVYQNYELRHRDHRGLDPPSHARGGFGAAGRAHRDHPALGDPQAGGPSR